MAADSQPLLTEGQVPDVDGTQHFCARCSSELELQHGYTDSKKKSNLRAKLIFVAIVLSFMIFAFAVAEMATAGYFDSPTILQLFVALWTGVTITILSFLLYMGCRRPSPDQSRHPLGRTPIQIYILCALAVTWIIFMIAMMTQNPVVCARWYGPVPCGMFTTAHVLSWFLIIALFWAAYATYRRAVAIHGTSSVVIQTPPPLVEAWRLSDVADGEGAIKI